MDRVLVTPHNQLTEEDVLAILAFIKIWWTAEQREIQADASERYDAAPE